MFQLEQWRDHLPSAIAFETSIELPPPRSAEDVLVIPWLQARYLIAKWHIGRPFL